MTIELRPITRQNWRACVRLRVATEQEQLVATNAGSLAQAAYEPECVPLAVYDGDTMVGFVMYALDADDNSYWIYRVMIDAQQQRRGYGRAAMERLIEHMRALPGCDAITISYVEHNDAARQLYRSLGFVETGEVIEGEALARLRLDPATGALT